MFVNTTMSLSLTNSLSIFLAKAFSAYLCALYTTQTNLWLLLRVGYYFTRYFGEEAKFSIYVNEYYEYICTFMLDIAFLSQFGVAQTQNTLLVTSC